MTVENPKFRQIITTGQKLFWKFGVKRVSIEEICSEASVSKATFYKHFQNKIELTKYILNQMFEQAIQEYHQIMESDISYVDKVNEIISMKLRNSAQFSKEFLEDIYKGKVPELQLYISEYSQKTIKMLRNDFIIAQKEGHIRKDVHVDMLMAFLNKMLDLASDPGLNSIYDSPHDMIRDFTNFFYYGVVSREKQ
jgi:AcrR family transcriptional regulator